MGGKGKIRDGSLYLVLSSEYAAGRDILTIAWEAVTGGIDLVQMREKNADRGKLLGLGRALAALCRRHGVVFIVNDDPSLAHEIGADGVHLGQEDRAVFPIAEARRILGPDRMIGVSTHDPDQFEEANGLDLDYIAYGPIFPTKTKSYCIGIQDVRAILQRALKPVFLIGGIDPSNLDLLQAEGARNIALIRDIMQAADVAGKVAWYKERLKP